MSVENSLPRTVQDSYLVAEGYNPIIDKKIEILAAACLFAAGLYFTAVCSIGFSCCILLTGSFPMISALCTEIIHRQESESITESTTLSPEEIDIRIESARASLETTLENEVLTPQIINDKLLFWDQIPEATEYLNSEDVRDLPLNEKALLFRPWIRDHSNEVQELRLRFHRNMQIPREIALFTELQTLSILGEDLQLPDEIALLNQLHHFSYYDSIRTQIPQQIQLLRNIQSLELFIQNLSSIPEHLFNLEQLQALVISGLFSALPPGIQRLSNLQHLGIIHSNLREIPSGLVSLNNVQEVDLTGNNIDSLPQNYPFNNYLGTINLSENNLTAFPSWTITDDCNLDEIDLSNNFLLTFPEEDPMPEFQGRIALFGLENFTLPSWPRFLA